jgi:hypothetical protein
MRINLLLLFIFFTTVISAQDQLFKKDNSKLEVKVLEITPAEIKYKLKANPDGPMYVIAKHEVALIIYENGRHEAFKEETPAVSIIQQPAYVPTIHPDSVVNTRRKSEEKLFEELTQNKNVIFLNMCELFNTGVGLSYFREMIDGLLDIHVPIAFSMGDPYVYNAYRSAIPLYYYNVANYRVTRKAFEGGLGIYFNTSPKRAVTHFIGPLMKIAQYNGSFQTAYPDPFNPYNTIYEEHTFIRNETYMLLNNGFLFRINPNINLMMNFALGMITNVYHVANNPNSFPNPYYYNTTPNSVPIFQFGFHFGYRF